MAKKIRLKVFVNELSSIVVFIDELSVTFLIWLIIATFIQSHLVDNSELHN